MTKDLMQTENISLKVISYFNTVLFISSTTNDNIGMKY